jgi:membrane protease YdiL (CAAX protease family)
VVVFFIGAIVGTLLALPVVAAVGSHRLDLLSAQAAGEAGLGGTTVLWLWLMHRRSIGALGAPRDVPRELGMGALSGLGLYVLGVVVIGTIVESVLRSASHHRVHSPRQLPTHLTGAEIVLAGVTVLILAPVAEELFFRGLLFRSLRARHSFRFAGAISALCFGAVHYPGGSWQNSLLLPIVMSFTGFGLAWVYEWRGTIVANMAAHAAFNVVGFLFIVTVLNH